MKTIRVSNNQNSLLGGVAGSAARGAAGGAAGGAARAATVARLCVAALLCAAVTVVLALCLAAKPQVAFANMDGTDEYLRVHDYTDTFDDDQQRVLSRAVKDEVRTLKFDFVVYVTNSDGDATSLARAFYEHNNFGYGEDDDGIILALCPSKGTAGVYACGLGTVVFSDPDIAQLASTAASDLSSGLYTASYNFCRTAILKVATYRGVDASSRWPEKATASSTGAATTTGHTTDELSWYPKNPSEFKDFHNTSAPRVVDNANIISAEDEAALTARIADMTERLGLDFVVYTDVSSYGESRGLFAADFYQFNGYGKGDDYSGVIFFVCMESGNRGFWTAARGSARDLLTEENVNHMDDIIYDYFKDGEYSKGCVTQVDNLDTLYTNGAFPFDWTSVIGVLFCAFIAWIIGGFKGLKEKKQAMVTVSCAYNAKVYADAPVFWVKTDREIDRSVTRTKHYEPSDSDSDSGSSSSSSYSGSYSSSGGATFSGGGRSF